MSADATLVDNINASQSREVFWDRDVYDLEIERIFFARLADAWPRIARTEAGRLYHDLHG